MEQRSTTPWYEQGARGEPREIIWLRSIGGTLLAIIIGFANMAVVQRLLPELVGAFVAVAAGGVIAGAVQGSFMRRYTQPALVWLSITAIGWVAVFIALRMPDWWLLTAAEVSLSRVLVCASMISVPQWWMLRRNVGRAWWWVVINIGCWVVALLAVGVLLG